MRWLFLFLLLSLRLCSTAQDTIPARKPITANAVIKASLLPVALIGYGIVCMDDRGFPSDKEVRSWRDDHFSSFSVHADDYLFYSNALLLYGFDLLKVKSKNDAWNQSVLLAKTSFVTLGTVAVLKYSVKAARPDGGNNLSFPSGHTAVAFAYATVLHKEFKDASPWIGVLGYSTATVTGAMRVLNNRHWFSDVLAGAGIGILSTNLVYLTHQYRFGNGRLKNSGCLPIIGKEYYGLMWQKTF